MNIIMHLLLFEDIKCLKYEQKEHILAQKHQGTETGGDRS